MGPNHLFYLKCFLLSFRTVDKSFQMKDIAHIFSDIVGRPPFRPNNFLCLIFFPVHQFLFYLGCRLWGLFGKSPLMEKKQGFFLTVKRTGLLRKLQHETLGDDPVWQHLVTKVAKHITNNSKCCTFNGSGQMKILPEFADKSVPNSHLRTTLCNSNIFYLKRF